MRGFDLCRKRCGDHLRWIALGVPADDVEARSITSRRSNLEAVKASIGDAPSAE
jgi:hypothetical protein